MRLATRAARVVSLFLLVARPLLAGEQIMAEFKDKRAVSPEALRQVPLKSVVTEFLDPGDTGLGKSLSYLLWRETLTAISDQAGAGVIVAEAPAGERLVDLLQQDYHTAALRIATNQRARLALWGAVDAERDRLFVDTYLTVLTAEGASDLRLKLAARTMEPGDAQRQIDKATSAFEARLGRSRFGLATVETTREELFARPLVLERAATLRERPVFDAPVLARVPAGSVLQSVDMDGAWFVVRLDDGRRGYLPAGRQEGSTGTLMALTLPPKYVDAAATAVTLRTGPGKQQPVARTRDLRGRFRVLDMRYKPQQGLWYRIALEQGSAWVPAYQVRPRFSLPAVHLLAGFYRYYAERFADAAGEFESFLTGLPASESAANRATALQLLGASRLVSGDKSAAWKALTQSIETTPYDPDAYMTRSIACVGLGRPDTALDDVSKALELDPRNQQARSFALAIWEVAERRTAHELTNLSRLDTQRARSAELLRRYGIKPSE